MGPTKRARSSDATKLSSEFTSKKETALNMRNRPSSSKLSKPRLPNTGRKYQKSPRIPRKRSMGGTGLRSVPQPTEPCQDHKKKINAKVDNKAFRAENTSSRENERDDDAHQTKDQKTNADGGTQNQTRKRRRPSRFADAKEYYTKWALGGKKVPNEFSHMIDSEEIARKLKKQKLEAHNNTNDTNENGKGTLKEKSGCPAIEKVKETIEQVPAKTSEEAAESVSLENTDALASSEYTAVDGSEVTKMESERKVIGSVKFNSIDEAITWMTDMIGTNEFKPIQSDSEAEARGFIFRGMLSGYETLVQWRNQYCKSWISWQRWKGDSILGGHTSLDEPLDASFIKDKDMLASVDAILPEMQNVLAVQSEFLADWHR